MDKQGALDCFQFKVALQALHVDVTQPNFGNLVRRFGTPQDGWEQRASDPSGPCPLVYHIVTQAKFRDCGAEAILNRPPDFLADKTFELFHNGQGRITWEDLRRVMKSIDKTDIEDKQLKSMIACFDIEGKGWVDRDEFRTMMATKGN